MVPAPYRQSGFSVNLCRACGKPLRRRRVRYCSADCRKELHWQLWITEGLLKALDCRFATFHWTDRTVILQVLPRQSESVFCFCHDRTPQTKPVAGLKHLTNNLSSSWWSTKKNGTSKATASRRTLARADGLRGRDHLRLDNRTVVRPQGVSHKDITVLRLEIDDLFDDDAMAVVKRSFRKRAKEAHPDRGGSSEDFQRLWSAYTNLLRWAENPALVTINNVRLPDGWVYDSLKREWYPPSC